MDQRRGISKKKNAFKNVFLPVQTSRTSSTVLYVPSEFLNLITTGTGWYGPCLTGSLGPPSMIDRVVIEAGGS